MTTGAIKGLKIRKIWTSNYGLGIHIGFLDGNHPVFLIHKTFENPAELLIIFCFFTITNCYIYLVYLCNKL
jgi:hypothetical protein